jgi:hypothetical protein
MPVSGQLSSFSLPEILRFVEEGNKTGLLTIRSLPSQTEPFKSHFIWLHQGRIIAAADRNDYRGLVRLIAHYQWIPTAQLLRLVQQCPLQTAFGTYLKSQGLLSTEQLKTLFSVQIIREICALFELSDGSFHFTSNVQLPYLEMIGTSVPATEVTLPGLRNLRNWSALEDKLPNSTSGLISRSVGNPQIHLNQLEWQVWEFTSGTVSLTEIAERLSLSLESVQRTAFCLMVAGLAEEIPLVELTSQSENMLSHGASAASSGPSQEFLSQMIGFLKKQIQS